MRFVVCCYGFHFEPPPKIMLEKNTLDAILRGYGGQRGSNFQPPGARLNFLGLVYFEKSCYGSKDHPPTRATLGEQTFHTFPYKT